MIDSIHDIGLLYPVLVDRDNRLIDGHRRLAACKKLGYYHIRAIRVDTEFEYSYGSVQSNQEKLTGVDLLGVYLQNPNALMNKQKDRIAAVEKEQGTDFLRYLWKNRYSTGIYYTARRVVNYIGGDIPIVTTTKWLVKYNLRGKIRSMLETGEVKASTLKAAIAEDRPLKFKTIISVREKAHAT